MTDDVATPLRPIGLRTLIDEAVKQVRRHFRALFPSIAIPLVISVSPLFVIYMRSMSSFIRFDEQAQLDDVLPLFLLAGVIYVLWMAVYSAAFVAALHSAMDTLSGRPVSMWKNWLWMFRPKVAGTLGLVFLCSAVASLMCVFPGFYVSLILTFVLPVMVAEDRFGTAALKRSARLLHFNRRQKLGDNPVVKVFVLFLVGWILSAVLSMFVQLLLTIVQQIIMFRSAAEGNAPDPIELMERLSWIQLPSAAIGSLATALMFLYLGFGLSLLFFDVRRRREGEDLEAALEELDPQAAGESMV